MKPKHGYMVRFNFFRSADGEQWEPIPRERVPAILQTDEVIERLLDGEGAEYQGYAYVALRQETQGNEQGGSKPSRKAIQRLGKAARIR